MMPRVVYVGPHDLRVRVLTNMNVAGQANIDQGEILVRKDLSPSNRRDTLLHELLHAISYHSGNRATVLDGDSDLEERIIVTLSPWILQMLQGNPSLVEYLMESHERES